MRPLIEFTLPTSESNGCFGKIRKYDIHTGIDLYCNDGDTVYAIEDGIVISVEWFTGEKAGSPWWNNTKACLVEGKSGVILYGEINTPLHKGDVIKECDIIGSVQTVLMRNKGLPMDMLHLELYETGYRGSGEIWKLNCPKPSMLLDPSKLVSIQEIDLNKILGYSRDYVVHNNRDSIFDYYDYYVTYTLLYNGHKELYHLPIELITKWTTIVKEFDAYLNRIVSINKMIEF